MNIDELIDALQRIAPRERYKEVVVNIAVSGGGYAPLINVRTEMLDGQEVVSLEPQIDG